uniref:Uncharacterized protein n=1 Tax=Cyanistes caeruleus TaxID=156563 RepID=A0A8C0ZGZ5_CYACU
EGRGLGHCKLDLLGQCLLWHSPPGRDSKSKPRALMIFLSREKNPEPQTWCELSPGHGVTIKPSLCSAQNLCVNISPEKPLYGQLSPWMDGDGDRRISASSPICHSDLLHNWLQATIPPTVAAF